MNDSVCKCSERGTKKGREAKSGKEFHSLVFELMKLSQSNSWKVFTICLVWHGLVPLFPWHSLLVSFIMSPTGLPVPITPFNKHVIIPMPLRD